MSRITIKSNIINWEINQGSSADVAINKSDGWTMYDEIVMDFKIGKNINGRSFLRLLPGDGMTIDGNVLLVSLKSDQTRQFPSKIIYADIRLRIGVQILDPIPFILTLKDTVTRL
jgi:hypothetical protein